MSKCGCGDLCNCLVVEGVGTDIPGTGNGDNPYVVNVDGSEISGDGIGWVGNKFVVRLAPGGNLEFDAGGNLRATGGGGGGGGGGNIATVKQLEDATTDLVGGSLGAGYYAKPQGVAKSYEHGLTVGLHFMSVPVRFLRDGTPVVWFWETLRDISGGGGDTEQVQEQEINRWESILYTRPGWKVFHDVDGGAPPSNGSTLGWFGYFEQGQYGMLTLTELLRRVGGKVVLLLNLQFPALNGTGNFIYPTPAYRTDLFLGRVRDQIRQFGLQDSVIVGVYAVSIPSGINPPRINVLDYFANSGIRVCLQLDTVADTQNFPAATLPNNWTWVMMSASLSNAVIQPYVNKPKFVIIYGISRQYLRAAKVILPNGVGAKGVLSADPEYYGGPSKFGNRHRDMVPQYHHQNVWPGYIPYGGDSIAQQSSVKRGSFRQNQNRLYLDPEMDAVPANPRQLTKWVTVGTLNPNPNPTSWGLDFGVGYDWSGQIGGYRWLQLAFGIATDHNFRDIWEPQGGTIPPPDPVNFPLDSGYAFLYDTNGFIFLESWLNGGRQEVYPAAGQTPANRAYTQNTARYFRLGVNANGIRLSDATFNPTTKTYTQGAVIFDVKTDLAKQYRGPYMFFGRHVENTGGTWWAFLDNPQMLLNAAAPIGPPA